MSAQPYRVRRSAIHGRGVFAARDLMAGELLMEYAGERIDWDEACRRYEASGTAGHTFFFDIGDGRVIDGGSSGNAARWINHGCAPNVEATLRGRSIELHALTDLGAGEELLLDYRLVVEDAERDLYACRCGAVSCRGTMLAG